MRLIPLLHGGYAIVDDADFERISRFRWHVDSNGYARCCDQSVPGGFRWIHKEIMQAPPDFVADHVNLDKLDDRRSNLRAATREGNARNRSGFGGSSRFKGVTWHAGCRKWQAAIKVANRNFYLGLFENEESAARAYDRAAADKFGEFAFLNFRGVA